MKKCSVMHQESFAIPILGPRQPRGGQDMTAPARLTIQPGEPRAQLSLEDGSGAVALEQGKWSDWLKVRFKSGMLQAVQGMLRFYVRELGQELELYASPVNFDPQAPLFPVSSPEGYAAELERRLGTFYTLGMAEDHDGLINGRFNEEAFLEQCSLVMRDRRRMMFSELDQFSEGFFFCLYDTPDRLQHMFWRFLEPDHPANAGQPVDHLTGVIREHYLHLDAIVGKVIERLDPETLLIVLSDQDEQLRRGLNLNTCRIKTGFRFENGSEPGDEHPTFSRVSIEQNAGILSDWGAFS
jgi:hypothetical protein